MKLSSIFYFAVFIIAGLASCKASSGGTSMIIGDHYEEKKDETILTLLPYGNIVIPGKWTKTHYNQTSKQHTFKSADSTSLAVAKNPKDKFSFYKKEMSDKEFVHAFVDWETDYYGKQGVTSRKLDDQSDKGYIIWKAEKPDENVNTTVLYGVKNGFAYGFMIPATQWSEERVKTFLVGLFNAN